MSWLEKQLKKALGKITPQYADTVTEEWEITKGQDGAVRSLPWSEDGEQLFTASKPGKVSVEDSALPTGAATEAKQDTLIAKDFATSAKQDAAKAVLESLVAKDYATQTTLAAVLAKIIAAPATEAKQDAAKAVLDLLATAAKQDAAKTVLDAIQAAVEGTVDVSVTGSIPEYGPWLHSDAEPTPEFDRAFGVRIEANKTLTVMYWDGTAWEEVA